MKRILLFLALLAAPLMAQNAGNGPVTKKTSGADINKINEDLIFGSGRTLTVDGTLNGTAPAALLTTAATDATTKANAAQAAAISSAATDATTKANAAQAAAIAAAATDATTKANAAQAAASTDATSKVAVETARATAAEATKAALDLSNAEAQVALTQRSNPNAMRVAWSKLYSISQGTPAQLRIMVWGDSVAWGKPAFLVGELAKYGVAGLTTSPAATVTAGARAANGSTVPYDFTISPSGDFAETNGTGEIAWGDGSAGVLIDTIKVFYGKGPGYGTFKVQTQADGGSWVDEAGFTSVAASDASTGLGVATVSKTAGRYRVKVVGLTGNVKCIPPLFRYSAGSGVEVYRVDRGGIALPSMLTTPAVVSALMSAVAPDLVFFEMKESASIISADLPTLTALTTAASPNTRWAFVASSPLASGDADQVAQNVAIKSQAATLGAYVFDAHTFAGGSYAAFLADGFTVDGTHPTASFDALASGRIADDWGILYPVSQPIQRGGSPRAAEWAGYASSMAGLDWRQSRAPVVSLDGNEWILPRGPSFCRRQWAASPGQPVHIRQRGDHNSRTIGYGRSCINGWTNQDSSGDR